MFKKKKTFCRKKVIVCSKGLKGAPSNPLKLYFLIFLKKISPIKKINLDTNSGFFHKNMHVTIKKEIFYRKVFELQRFSKGFPNVGGNALFWRGH